MTGAGARPAVTLDDVREARERIGARTRRTPMMYKHQLTRILGVPMHLKGEHLQRTGSFKLRGALNLISRLDADQRTRGVVAASAGNHAQGVAVAAAEYGVGAHIWMPEDAPLPKIEATRSYGAEVTLQGANLSESLAHARAWCEQAGAVWVHPFEDPRIIAGQGTVGLEILEQLPDVETVIVPVGGGGLYSGIATVMRELRPDVRLVGVQSEACPSITESFAAGRPVEVHARPTMADGIAVKQPGDITFDVISSTMDSVINVSDDDIARAVLWLMERAKQVVEGAGAAGVAALLSGAVEATGPTVCVLSGGNIDPMSLMPVIRSGLTSLGRFLRVEVILPDRPGELSRVLALLARHRANIVAIDHQREGVSMQVGNTRVQMTVQTRDTEHVEEVISALVEAGFEASQC